MYTVEYNGLSVIDRRKFATKGYIILFRLSQSSEIALESWKFTQT